MKKAIITTTIILLISILAVVLTMDIIGNIFQNAAQSELPMSEFSNNDNLFGSSSFFNDIADGFDFE